MLETTSKIPSNFRRRRWVDQLLATGLRAGWAGLTVEFIFIKEIAENSTPRSEEAFAPCCVFLGLEYDRTICSLDHPIITRNLNVFL